MQSLGGQSSSRSRRSTSSTSAEKMLVTAVELARMLVLARMLPARSVEINNAQMVVLIFFITIYSLFVFSKTHTSRQSRNGLLHRVPHHLRI